MHFGILKTTERTAQLLIPPLGTDWVATAGRSSDMYISPWLQFRSTSVYYTATVNRTPVESKSKLLIPQTNKHRNKLYG